MPKVQEYKAQIGVQHSQVGRNTGLRTAPIDLTSRVPQAVGKVGEAIANVGELIYLKNQQHEAQDRDIAIKKLHQDDENQRSQFYNRIQEASTSEEILQINDEYIQWNKTRPDYTDTNKIGDEFGYYGERLKKIGWTEATAAQYQINTEHSKNMFNTKVSKIVADAKRTSFVQERNVASQQITGRMLSGEITYEDAFLEVVKQYQSTAYPDEFVLPLIEEQTQNLTASYLDQGFDSGDASIIQKAKNGEFNNELINPFEEDATAIVNQYRDKAIRAEKSLNEEAKRRSNEVATINKRIQKEAHDKYVNDLSIQYDSDNPPTIMEIENNVTLSGDEKKKWKEVMKQQAKGNDLGKITDVNKERELNEKIRDIDPSTSINEIEKIEDEIHDATFKGYDGGVSRTVRDNLLKKLNTAIKEEEKPYNERLKRTISDGRGRITSGFGSTLMGYKGFALKKANNFEVHLNTLLEDKDLETRMKMITPGDPMYVIENLIEGYKLTPEDIREGIQGGLKSKRIEDETYEQFLKRKGSKTFYAIDDPKRVKAVSWLKKWKIPVNPESIDLVIKDGRYIE